MNPGWSRAAAERNKLRWPYAHMLVDNEGRVLTETIHGTIGTLMAEVRASGVRVEEADPAAGPFPIEIFVDGIAEVTWRRWIAQDKARRHAEQ